MAETSRSQVTITLGRSGQVVKRAGHVLDSGFSDSQPAVGSKRSVRDRLGSSNVDHLDIKRQRVDNNKLSLKASKGIDDTHLGKNDLRFKIMKRTQSLGQQNMVDLREMLSRPARTSTTITNTHQRIPEPRNGRQLSPDPERMREPRNGRRLSPDPEPRHVRQHIPKPIEVRQCIPELSDFRQRIPEPTNGSIPGRINSMRSADALPQIRNSYSPWTLDHIRRRSPDRVLDTSRGRSPPRNVEEPQRRPIMRAYDDVRTTTYGSRDVHELSRPMASASFMTKPALPAGHAKTLSTLAGPPLPPSGVVRRSPYTVKVDEQLTLEGFLHSLGLDKYAISFKVEEVDMAALSQMGDNDLKELGIPMGPRKKILLALLSRRRQQAR